LVCEWEKIWTDSVLCLDFMFLCNYIITMKAKNHTMFESLEKKVLSYCIEKQLFTSGEEVVLGVSGGADSVCLLFVLHRLQQELGIHLHVVHVNHLIREDAGEDAEYVRQLCEKLQVSYHYVACDVKKMAEMKKGSEEEVGRQVRYEAFEEEARRVHATTIAVAHHKNDRAETMLFQLFRGSGITGMTGMREKRNCSIGMLVRPLLCLSREEIEEYLALQNIPFRTDSTNETDDYARNRIRHHILPYATEQICAGAVDHLWNTAEFMGELDDYLMLQVAEAEKRCVEMSQKVGEPICLTISLPLLEKEHVAIRRTLLHELIKKAAGAVKDISSVHVIEVWELCQTEGNRKVNLPYGVEARRSYDRVILQKKDRKSDSAKGTVLAEPVSIPLMEEACEAGTVFTIQLQDKSEKGKTLGVIQLQCRVFSYEEELAYPTEADCKWFDLDLLPKNLVFRHRKTGDEIAVSDGANGLHEKRIKDIMINDKIPAEDRDNIWLMCADGEVFWILGGRISEKIKVNKKTRRIMEIRILGNDQ